jgi:hypothetical protein
VLAGLTTLFGTGAVRLLLGLGRELVEERVTPAPPRLEPIVPNSGNRLKTKPFTLPQSVS